MVGRHRGRGGHRRLEEEGSARRQVAGALRGRRKVPVQCTWRFFPASGNKDRLHAIQSAEGSARPPWCLDKCHPQVTAEDVQTHSSRGALSRVGPVPEWAVSCVRAATGSRGHPSSQTAPSHPPALSP